MLVPETVRAKALAAGAADWLDGLPSLIRDIEQRWSITVGHGLTGGTAAFVAEATLTDGRPAVLKLMIPRADGLAANEITALRLADGDGCVGLLAYDVPDSALLMERLGAPLADLGLPLQRRHEILCRVAARVWRPAPGTRLPTGADKGRWLASYIGQTWEDLDRPCSSLVIEHALAAVGRRIASHDDTRAVLVHGDVHQWNTLQAGTDFKLIDPDGLQAEAEYDLGIIMREDPKDLLRGDPHERARWLAHYTGLDSTAIWEWGVVERVSTGLLCTAVDLQPAGRLMLAAAERIARDFVDVP